MSLNELIYNTALGEVGTVEWAVGSNPAVVKYYAEAGHPEVTNDEVPWCAAFIGSILARCGLLGTGSLMARSYTTWGEDATNNPMRGDIVVFKRGAPPAGHVAVFIGFVGNRVKVIGGNQRDRVSEESYPKDDIIAIRRAATPRTGSAVKSSTVQAVGVSTIATGVSAVNAVSALEGTTQLVAIVSTAIVALALIYIARERIKKWAAGVK